VSHPIHHLEGIVQFARADLRLNGFPLGDVEARDETAWSFAPPVNPVLAGPRNVVEVILDVSMDFDGKPLPFEKVQIELTVRRFEKGGIVEPGAGELVTRLVPPPEVMKDIAEGKLKPPVTLTHRFASQGPDFSDELYDAKPFTDEKALRDYGVKLRGLVVKRDVAGLLAEHEPKVQAWAKAYAEPIDRFRASLKEELAKFIAAGADVAFTPDDIEARSCCGGRIWELRRKRNLPLLRTLPGEEGERSELSAFVALRGGALRIVR
jgi:hypothetical protein